MTVEQQCAPKSVKDPGKFILDRPVIRTVHLVQTRFQFMPGDGLSPQRAMARRAPRDYSQAAARPRTKRRYRTGSHDRGIDLVFSPIAVDGAAGSARDHGTNSSSNRAFDELVYERIFQRVERTVTPLAGGNQPIGIVTAGMRNGEEHGNIRTRRMDVRG